ncbi:MAG: lipoyl(octanoyl) transferase LipB [Acidobacteria bacterium]|nr:MAG: lipoyl(octanoyl) transferase LipB [Acidobacteriota bacterium]REK08568.1 MAG: lipoyl(octanoyl) transferase LipB [Acidobacteriota bacterium]
MTEVAKAKPEGAPARLSLRETPSSERPLRTVWLGRCGYRHALAVQEGCREAVLAAGGERPETLYLLEHDHVFTLGRNAVRGDIVASDEWLAARGVEVVECDRGGKVTYHGPGQLVGYPVISLQPDRRDVRRFVADLMQVLVRTVGEYGVEAEAGQGDEIGVWTRPDPERFRMRRKIASIGVHLKRWTSTHGLALNVAPDLGFFGGIVPCGLHGVELTSIERETGAAPRLEEVAAVLDRHFRQVFGRPLGGRYGDAPEAVR